MPWAHPWLLNHQHSTALLLLWSLRLMLMLRLLLRLRLMMRLVLWLLEMLWLRLVLRLGKGPSSEVCGGQVGRLPLRALRHCNG